jgi:hypothetical protein
MPRGLYNLRAILVLALNLLAVGCDRVALVDPPASGMPAISAVSPVRATVGEAGFTLTVDGANFTQGSTVLWNNQALATTFVTTTELSAEAAASNLGTAGTVTVTVRNPAPVGGLSNAAAIDVEATNPVPAISALSPDSVTAGSGGFTLIVNGTGILATSVVAWNGVSLPTTQLSSTQLQALVPASATATAGIASVSVGNPAPGGGTSAAASFDIVAANPVPMVSSIAPAAATAGATAFTLSVNGSNFIASSAVRWNGSAVATTYVSTTELTAIISAADIAGAGSAPVTVVNPAPGGGTSTAAVFTINPANPAPRISSTSPTSAAAGAAALTLTVNGTGFIGASAVTWNGIALATSYVSASQLTATITAADLASAGTDTIAVVNPTPGGGTSNAASFAVIANNPVPSISAISPTSTSSGLPAFTLTVSGSGFINASTINWNGTALPTTYSSSSSLSAQVPASYIAAAGSASITVQNPTPGGGKSNSASFAINQSNPLPAISSMAPSSVQAGSSAFSLTVHGTGFVATSIVNWNGIALPTTYNTASQLVAQVPASDVSAAGTVSITVSSPTPGGGTSAAATFAVSGVNPAPAISSLLPSSVSAGAATFSLVVNGNNFISSSTVNWNGTALPTAFNSSTTLTAQVPALDVAIAATASITVITPGPGGGTSNAASFAINASNPQPSISSLSPLSVIAGSPAFALTVNGSGFISSSTVDWNGSVLPTTYLSATSLTAQVSAADVASATSASLTVVNPAPGGGTSGAATLVVTASNPAPGLSSLSPTSAVAGSGAFVLTVNGTNFVSTSVVNWAGAALPTTVVSATQLTAQVPASDINAAGSAAITVATPTPGGGTSGAATFTIIAANPVPSVSSLTPSSVIEGASAFPLTMTGTNFISSSTVTWNGTALPTTYGTPTQLTAQVPANDVSSAGTALIAVSNPAPGGGISGNATFSIASSNPAPGLSDLSPTSAIAGGGAFALTVDGSNLVATSEVYWNGNQLPTTYVSATQLIAQVPAADISIAGSASVTVVTPSPGGGTSNALNFTISAANPIPSISQLAPVAVTAGAGSLTLTVTGSNFISSSVVNWDGVALPTTFISATEVSAQVPATDDATSGTASVTVSNPAPGGGTSGALTFTINAANPAPIIGSLTPSSVPQGSAAFSLTVTGSSFISSSTVTWNGANLPTTYVSATQLTAQVPATDLNNAGTDSVAVVTPTPGGGTSLALSFTVTGVNPAPTLSSLSPASVLVGSGTFALTVNGSGFLASSTVHWNGAALPTTYVSATQLSAQVPASDVASIGSANITVVNPGPGGGTSSGLSFSINSSVTTGPTLVQHNLQQTINNNTENQAVVQFNSPTTAGNLIWVAVTVSDYDGAHTITVTDSQGNTFTELDQVNDQFGQQTVAQFYAPHIVGDSGSPDTITVSWGNDDYKGVVITEIGGATANPLVGHSSNDQLKPPATTDAISAGSIAVPATDTPALVLAITMNTSGGASDTGGSGYGAPSPGTGFTQVLQCWDYGSNLATLESATVSGTSVDATFTPEANDNVDAWATVAAVFH